MEATREGHPHVAFFHEWLSHVAVLQWARSYRKWNAPNHTQVRYEIELTCD